MGKIYSNINYRIDEGGRIKEYMRGHRIYTVGDDEIVEDVNRAGIAFYTRIEGKIYYLLGIDDKSQNYSDFGGKVEKHEKSNFYDTAIRELHEETCGLFHSKYPDISSFVGSIVIVESKVAIIFKELDINLDSIIKHIIQFHRLEKSSKEMCSLILIDQTMKNLHNIYRKIREHFYVFDNLIR